MSATTKRLSLPQIINNINPLSPSNLYSPPPNSGGSVQFILLCKRKKGEPIHEASNSKTCREAISNGVFHHLNYNLYQNYCELDLEKFRMLVYKGYEDKDLQRGAIRKALKLINRYGELAGFSRTIMRKVDHYSLGNIYMIVGDKRWYKFPALTSLITLILRMSLKSEKDFTIGDDESTHSFWKRTACESSDYTHYVSRDNNYKKFDLIFSNFNKIFPLDIINYYPKNMENPHVGAIGGISSLCGFYTYDAIVNCDFYKVCKQHKVNEAHPTIIKAADRGIFYNSLVRLKNPDKLTIKEDLIKYFNAKIATHGNKLCVRYIDRHNDEVSVYFAEDECRSSFSMGLNELEPIKEE